MFVFSIGENHSNQSNSHQTKLKVAQPEEQDVSDSSDYNDAWGDEEWQDVKEVPSNFVY